MTAYTVPLDREHHEADGHLVPGQPVTLDLEQGAPYAIRVLDADGACLGYVNRLSAKWIGERLHRGKFVHASIAEVTLGPEAKHGHGIHLSIRTEPAEMPRESSWWKRLRGV